MKVFAINGSPRKNWNTATLLNKALEGAQAQGAETKLIHLYDLDFKGCKSCFTCKLLEGKSFGRCATRDDITPILEEIPGIDALILGTPIYYGSASGVMRMFFERLFYPYMSYNPDRPNLFSKKINFGFIYTMNISEAQIEQSGLESYFSLAEFAPRMIFGTAESLFSTDTLQFDDYSKTGPAIFDPVQKLKRHNEVFPVDCKKAFDMGGVDLRTR